MIGFTDTEDMPTLIFSHFHPAKILERVSHLILHIYDREKQEYQSASRYGLC